MTPEELITALTAAAEQYKDQIALQMLLLTCRDYINSNKD